MDCARLRSVLAFTGAYVLVGCASSSSSMEELSNFLFSNDAKPYWIHLPASWSATKTNNVTRGLLVGCHADDETYWGVEQFMRTSKRNRNLCPEINDCNWRVVATVGGIETGRRDYFMRATSGPNITSLPLDMYEHSLGFTFAGFEHHDPDDSALSRRACVLMLMNFWKMLVAEDGRTLVDVVVSHNEQGEYGHIDHAILARMWRVLLVHMGRHVTIPHWVFDVDPLNLMPPTPAAYDKIAIWGVGFGANRHGCWGGSIVPYAQYSRSPEQHVNKLNARPELVLNGVISNYNGTRVKGSCWRKQESPAHHAIPESIMKGPKQVPQSHFTPLMYEVEALVDATRIPVLSWGNRTVGIERVLVIVGHNDDLRNWNTSCDLRHQIIDGKLWQCTELKIPDDLVIGFVDRNTRLAAHLRMLAFAFQLSLLMLLWSDGPESRPTTVLTHRCGDKRHEVLGVMVSLITSRMQLCGANISHGVIGQKGSTNLSHEKYVHNQPSHYCGGVGAFSWSSILWNQFPFKASNVEWCSFPFASWVRPLSMPTLTLTTTNTDITSKTGRPQLAMHFVIMVAYQTAAGMLLM